MGEGDGLSQQPPPAEVAAGDGTPSNSIGSDLSSSARGWALSVRLIEAKGLVAKDVGGTSDPFVVLRLRATGSSESISSKSTAKTNVGAKDDVYKTRVIEKNLEPEWNELFRLLDIDDDDIATKELHFSVWDWNLISSPDFMGQFAVPLAAVHSAHAHVYSQWVTLEARGKKDVVTGQVYVAVGLTHMARLRSPSLLRFLKHWTDEARRPLEEELGVRPAALGAAAAAGAGPAPNAAIAAALDPAAPREARHCLEALWELVYTERAYLRDVEVIITTFADTLSQRCLLSKQEVRTVFSNASDIYLVHVDFLAELNKAWDVLREQGPLPGLAAIGDLLKERADYFKIYAVYCSNQTSAMSAVASLRAKNSELDQFLNDALRFPECRNQGLNSFLIMPLQRLCKYPLLLREIMKNIDRSVDQTAWAEASAKFSLVAKQVNNRTRQVERVNEMMHLQAVIENADRFSLVTTGRFLVRESQLVRLENGRPITMFLFNDAVVLALKKTPKDGKPTYEIKEFFDMRTEVLAASKIDSSITFPADLAQTSSSSASLSSGTLAVSVGADAGIPAAAGGAGAEAAQNAAADQRFILALTGRRPAKFEANTINECEELIRLISKWRRKLPRPESARADAAPMSPLMDEAGSRKKRSIPDLAVSPERIHATSAGDLSEHHGQRRGGTMIIPRERSGTGGLSPLAAPPVTPSPVQELLRMRRAGSVLGAGGPDSSDRARPIQRSNSMKVVGEEEANVPPPAPVLTPAVPSYLAPLRKISDDVTKLTELYESRLSLVVQELAQLKELYSDTQSQLAEMRDMMKTLLAAGVAAAAPRAMVAEQDEPPTALPSVARGAALADSDPAAPVAAEPSAEGHTLDFTDASSEIPAPQSEVSAPLDKVASAADAVAEAASDEVSAPPDGYAAVEVTRSADESVEPAAVVPTEPTETAAEELPAACNAAPSFEAPVISVVDTAAPADAEVHSAAGPSAGAAVATEDADGAAETGVVVVRRASHADAPEKPEKKPPKSTLSSGALGRSVRKKKAADGSEPPKPASKLMPETEEPAKKLKKSLSTVNALAAADSVDQGKPKGKGSKIAAEGTLSPRKPKKRTASNSPSDDGDASMPKPAKKKPMDGVPVDEPKKNRTPKIDGVDDGAAKKKKKASKPVSASASPAATSGKKKLGTE